MRKMLALVLGITMGLVIVSCGNNNANNAATNAAAPAVVATNVVKPATNAAPATNVVKPAPAPVNKDAGQTKGLE